MRLLPGLVAVCALVVASIAAATASPAATATRRDNSPSGFVTIVGDKFLLDGKPFNFIGTDAYWLPMLNDTDAIRTVLTTIKNTGLSVVRLWAFNDVVDIPPDGATYFQLFQNGSATVNTGPNGLPRLDTVIDEAGKAGLKVFLTLTNNWNPETGSPEPSKFPHGYLSTAYGGMDLYVRQIKGATAAHDDFFDDETIKTAFKNYLNVIIARYASNPTVFGWELANDPRCRSSLQSKSSCKTTTITQWHSDIAKHVKTLDSNHIIASGAHGFQCLPELANCPKLFPVAPPPPPPQTSPGVGFRRRSARLLGSRTFRDIRRAVQKRRAHPAAVPLTKRKSIRGRWAPAATKRQAGDAAVPYLDGSQGVDSQDILGIPEIGFSTFQLFPDQNQYGIFDPSLSASQNAIQLGTAWIETQAAAAKQLGKPALLTAFGLVPQSSSVSYVPFGSVNALVPNPNPNAPPPPNPVSNVTDAEQAMVYSSWINAAANAGVNGVLHYQWSQTGLSQAQGGGVVTSAPLQNTTTSQPVSTGGTVTPDDGYGTQQGTGPGTLLNNILSQGSTLFG